MTTTTDRDWMRDLDDQVARMRTRCDAAVAAFTPQQAQIWADFRAARAAFRAARAAQPQTDFVWDSALDHFDDWAGDGPDFDAVRDALTG